MVSRKVWALPQLHLDCVLASVVVLLLLAAWCASDSPNHELVLDHVRWCLDSSNALLRV